MSKEILQFSANWCGPCKMLSPRMEKLQSEGKINYRKIDVDQDSDLSIKYSVRNIPTLILLENGEVKNRTTGVQTEQQLIDFYNG
jgi:thioredoxin 1